MLKPTVAPPASVDQNATQKQESSEDLVMIGMVGTPREAEIAYRLLPSYWGRGYMPEAVQLFLSIWWDLPGLFFKCSLHLASDLTYRKRIRNMTIS